MKKLILIPAIAAFVLSIALPTIEAAAPVQSKISAPHAKSAHGAKAKRRHHTKQAPKKQPSKASAHRHK